MKVSGSGDDTSASPAAPAPRPERRRVDRRGTERRRTDFGEWLDVLGVGADAQQRDDLFGAESGFVGGWPVSSQPPDSRFLSRQADRIVSERASTFHRIYRLFVGARAALGLALLFVQIVGGIVAERPRQVLLMLSLAYAVQAVSLWLLPRLAGRAGPPGVPRLTRAQWVWTIGVDLLVFSALHVLAPSTGLNYVALLVLPVLMSGVLTARLVALVTPAGVALLLLATAWRFTWVAVDVVAIAQAGLAGAGLFVIALMAGELAGRLAREEQTARGSLELARQQAQLNRLVIEGMTDGVLVVDRRARVRAANPAARRLLAAQGVCRPAPFQLIGTPAWESLTTAVTQAFEMGSWPEDDRDLTLHFDSGLERTLRVRARFTGRRATDGVPSEAPEELCVLFVEDLRDVQARNRQEKLAAMGRVSAGIAHEVRNPLAAIAQANALLLEDELSAEQAQLARMVADNVERLKRIVDDVMEVAPGAPPSLRAVDATAEVTAAAGEWARTTGVALGASSRLQLRLPFEPIGVVFDPDHLRRVLVNLLDNAHRHASDSPGAIELRLVRDGETVVMAVASDGPPIPAEVERHLFEPFFSTRSRGTGLGLYICRELCERYGAGIDYRWQPQGAAHRNEFIVTMRPAALTAPTETRLHL
jgi:two-component system sensor histidine kinase PilS (NtrC family)